MYTCISECGCVFVCKRVSACVFACLVYLCVSVCVSMNVRVCVCVCYVCKSAMSVGKNVCRCVGKLLVRHLSYTEYIRRHSME